MSGRSMVWAGGMLAAFAACAQDASALVQAQGARQTPGAADYSFGNGQGADALTRTQLPTRPDQSDEFTRLRNDADRSALEIQKAKGNENGPKRFASDLFDTRQTGIGLTDGGISEDYVLGVGDRLQMNVFGSATFETPLQVDGRGSVVIPKVGTVQVAGMTLGHARSAVQAKVGQIFSRSTADLSVTKLREVRVFILGEVYKPGSYLIPNLSSIVNVLGLSGGPTAVGSYRQIRVMRGGKIVHLVDLYPLRAEGLGNMNIGFQNGDTVFVPLIQNPVLLQGGFTRVVTTVQGDRLNAPDNVQSTDEQRRIERQISLLETRLKKAGGGDAPVASGDTAPSLDASARARAEAVMAKEGTAQSAKSDAGGTMSLAEQRATEENLDILRQYLRDLKFKVRGDTRIQGPIQRPDEMAGQPAWLRRWLQEGAAPVVQFEMLPGETVKDALRFAGGFALQAFSDSVSIRRISPGGGLMALDVPAGEQTNNMVLQKGDIVTALPLRESQDRAVKVSGWVRVQGTFARAEGQRVGNLLSKFSLLLPDSYLERGELVRTGIDGTKQYFAFNVTKALAGDPTHNLLLEDRDSIELYRIGDLRVPKTLSIVGPVTRPGAYEFIEGMRVSDLLFRAGVPLKDANRLIAELAHSGDGQFGQVKRIDLDKLLSTETSSPVDLADDNVNPKLMAFDQLSIYSKPDYRVHRSIILSGQVNRPGVYVLDNPHATLLEMITRAGGLTEDAMPEGGIFLRSMATVNPERKRASILSGLETSNDPTGNGINEILRRLSETKRNPTTGMLEPNALLHSLESGSLNRLVVNIPGILAGKKENEVELQDGDEILIPRKTSVAYVVGETASPFASFKVIPGMKVKDLLELAGGPTRNADTWNIRLLKADGRILDNWINGKTVEPGDALLVPQRIKRDAAWYEQLAALTPLAIMVNTFK